MCIRDRVYSSFVLGVNIFVSGLFFCSDLIMFDLDIIFLSSAILGVLLTVLGIFLISLELVGFFLSVNCKVVG